MRRMKKVVSVITAAAMAASLLAGCGSSGGSSITVTETKVAETTAAAVEITVAEAVADITAAPVAVENPVAGKKTAYIMLLPSATIFQMWKDSCASFCDALDVKFDFLFCDGDFNKWQDTIHTCAFVGYDGLLASHDNQDGPYVFLKEITEQYPDVKIVIFDIQFYSDGEYQKLPGITQMFQQDKSLVTVPLNQMIEKCGGGVHLIKVWRGPNHNSPFDRYGVGWQEYGAAGKIVIVGEVQFLQDSVDSANIVTAAYLQGVNRADVDGVIAYYDLCGQDVYNAVAENDNFNGKNGDAPSIVPVDIDPADATNTQTRPDTWTAAETTDWTTNGGIGMRILTLELVDQYDKTFDPVTGESGVDIVEVLGTAIKADALKPDSAVENLGNIAGETYGNLGYLSTADWMPKDLIHK